MQKFIGLWVISMLILTGCGGGGSTTPDTEPPQISQIEIEHAGDAVQVFATVQDAMSGIAAVQVVARIGTGHQTFLMTAESANRYRARLPGNTTRVAVRATDNAGNTRDSGEFIVPPPEPPF
jgi:hypothetical protein